MLKENEIYNPKVLLITYILVIISIIFFSLYLLYILQIQGKNITQQEIEKKIIENNLNTKTSTSNLESKNINIFEKCYTEENQIECINTFAQELAITEKNPSFCNYIENEELKENCYYETIKTSIYENSNISLCFSNSNNIELKCKNTYIDIYKNEIIPQDYCTNENLSQTEFNTDYDFNCYDKYLFEVEYKINSNQFVCEKFENEKYIENCNNLKIGEIKFKETGIEDFCNNNIEPFHTLCKKKYSQITYYD